MKRVVVLCAVLLALPCIALATPLPDTGQIKCYNNSVEITCPNPGEEFYGQDANYAPCNPHSYTKLDASGNDLPDDATEWIMVRDNLTGLIWEVKQNKDDMRNYDNPHDADNTYYWSDSIGDGKGTEDFINSLNSEQYGGYNDWRLPTVKELSTLVDLSIPYPSGPSINTDYFPNTVSSSYWSSTTTRGMYYPNLAWLVYFYDGIVPNNFKGWGYSYVRAVRSGHMVPSGDYVDNSDGTVTDLTSGLMWQNDTVPSFLYWQDALSYCENLHLAGYNDWRLPNRNELQSIVDYNRYDPSIDPIFFNTVSSRYWSSTTYAYTPSYAFEVEFSVGVVWYRSKSNSDHYVRAVRGGQCGSFGDVDSDGIQNDGDNSGIIGDNPCTGGQTANCDDNCPTIYNPFQIDCDNDGTGDVCDPDTTDPDGDGVDVACDNCFAISNPNQSDSYPPQGNGCGNACECEGNFDASSTVDGLDASTFKADYGRSSINRPCTAIDPCRVDFSCNGNVDGLDAALFKQDFGRSGINNPCPSCVTEPWCVYP